MVKPQQSWLYYLALFLAIFFEVKTAHILLDKYTKKSAEYLSPEFVMKPGSVVNRYYYDIDFPKGHIGIKDFNAEVVDEAGASVPLQDTYLHHWQVARYYVRKGIIEKGLINSPTLREGSDFMIIKNAGVCKHLVQYFGFGSETRKTERHVPDPYAIEVGNPDELPEGFEERWLLNFHAIDTRGAVDRLGCIECRCNLYNTTIDEFGKPISPNYEGGLYCCYDHTQCKVKEGFTNSLRKLYLKYTVKWFDWNKSFLPVKIYIFDITDTWKASNQRHHCKIEYKVSPCDSSSVSANGCIDNKKISFVMPRGGYLVYGVAHQHAGGIGSALYGKDGRTICSSIPTYGSGYEAGNESGYIVGMSTCYPDPGSIKINDGETLVLESNYSSSQKHTGVMGLFFILVSEQLPS